MSWSRVFTATGAGACAGDGSVAYSIVSTPLSSLSHPCPSLSSRVTLHILNGCFVELSLRFEQTEEYFRELELLSYSIISAQCSVSLHLSCITASALS